MGNKQLEPGFEQMSWHDCCIWGLRFSIGDPNDEDWTSDLELDIDFIVEWLRVTDDKFQFRVAPATLVFHGVTDPHIRIDWGNSGFQTAIHEVTIADITRERVPEQKVHLDRPYYKWRIALNRPEGEISFGAVGFTQTLLAEPVLTEQQHLSPSQRSLLTRDCLDESAPRGAPRPPE